MHRRRDGLQLPACQELHLVDQEHDARIVLPSRLAELLEQVRQIVLEVARGPAYRVGIERELNAAVG